MFNLTDVIHIHTKEMFFHFYEFTPFWMLMIIRVVYLHAPNVKERWQLSEYVLEKVIRACALLPQK